jgi:hypothetical protein
MPETMTLPGRAGLYTRDEAAVPLTGVSVVADIVGLCARVTITQRYENRETQPIEAVYVFPLDEGAAVCGFDALIDGTLVEGRAMEREDAFAEYDDAMQKGHGAFLLDEERPDVFQASIGNLPPGKSAIVKVTYVRELEVDHGLLRFVVPTTVAPRYAPAADHRGLGRSDAETLNPPLAWQVPYGLDLTVTLSIPGPIARVESSSHPISLSMADGRTTVTLAKTTTALDRDFVLTVAAEGLNQPRAWVERDSDGRAAIAVGFVPTLPAGTEAVEVIFLVDESGSMKGESIAEVRNALQLCLRSMSAGCRFNIVAFGSDYASLFPESRAYDQRALDAAGPFVDQLTGDRGGTEILPALRSVLERPTVRGLRRQVVVMTDGEVTNTDDVIALAREHSRTTRVFTFGIGASPSRHLVQGLARAGRGTSEFIAPGERIEPKVLRLFARLFAPALDDVTLDWGGLEVTQSPSSLPPVVSGMRMLAYGLASALKPATLTLRGTGANGPVTFEIPLDPSVIEEGHARTEVRAYVPETVVRRPELQFRRVIGTLAARARIRELEESPEWTSARRSRQGRARGGGQASREILELALRYNLASRETSLVAIERRESPVTGDLQLRRVPVVLAAGWGGRRPMATPIQPRARSVDVAYLAASAEMAMGGDDIEFDRLAAPRSAPSRIRASLDRLDGLLRRAASDRHAKLRDRVVALASLQRADGSWPLASPLADILDRPLRTIEKEMPSPDTPLARELWATALALAWLERHAMPLVSEWEMLATKAERWLLANAGGREVRERARQWLG